MIVNSELDECSVNVLIIESVEFTSGLVAYCKIFCNLEWDGSLNAVCKLCSGVWRKLSLQAKFFKVQNRPLWYVNRENIQLSLCWKQKELKLKPSILINGQYNCLYMYGLSNVLFFGDNVHRFIVSNGMFSSSWLVIFVSIELDLWEWLAVTLVLQPFQGSVRVTEFYFTTHIVW